MAQSCVTIPTLTRTDINTSQSFSTTVSALVSTLPGDVSTSVFRTCTVPSGVSTACVPTLTSTLITLPGSTTTVTVPVTITIDVPFTTTTTLFGSSCTDINTPPPDTTTPPPVITPPPTVLTSPSIVTSDSSTYTVIVTSTSTPPPYSSTPPPSLPTGTASAKKAVSVAPIVGGVVGGLAALALLGFLTWYLIKRTSKFDDFFNRDDTNNNNSAPYKKDPPVTDKPYHYGLVGQNNTNAVGVLPPTSPPPGAYGNDMGLPPSNSTPAAHIRNPSLTPLLAGVGAAAAASGFAAGSSSSRPSSSSSSQPLGPAVSHAAQGQGQGLPPAQNIPSQGYPPALQNWATNQGYGPMNSQGQGYGGQGYAGTSSSSGYAGGPGTTLSHNMSTTSTAPSTYSNPSWVGTSYNTAPGLVPVMATGIALNSQQHQQQHQQRPGHQRQPSSQGQQRQQYEDPFARTGSPVSVQEQRILQVTNAEPSSPYQPYAEASSSSSAGAGPSAGSSSGAQAAASPTYPTDGKGRPLNTLGEKAAMVHLDGGLYQQPPPGAAPAGAAPPAYDF
ncbi:hypothetical protein B0H34DRAFT_672623 [Crassisporium funariophilum]|nr:hypothetical protein B0H34DRAFT_672623 [Crassisporium funariophilum]